MKYLSVCSGIEAATAAWHSLGWEPVGFSEIEAFPSAVLKHHYPNVPNFGDMTKFKTWDLNESDVSLLVGGTPCQSFSVAGLRKGLSDDRGNLALTFCEMADHFDPEWVLWENVPGVLSSKDNAFGCLLAGLCGESEPIDPNGKWDSAGVVSGPKRTIAWRVLDAQYFGVAQRRRRVFVLAVRGSGNWSAARALFPVGESVFWNSAPSREKEKGFAAVAGTLAANGGGLTRPAGNCNELDFCVPVVPALTASGRGVERTGESRGQDPVVAVTARMTAFGEYVDDGTASTLKQRDYKDATDLVAQPIASQSVDHAADATIDLSPTIRRHDPMAVAFAQNTRDEVREMEVVGALAAQPGMKQTSYIRQSMQVRRLTPVECERLQGFPDNYTNIPWRTFQEAERKGISYESLLLERGMTLRGPSIEECPDGPRYKALGNSMAVPVMRWIGKRISMVFGGKV